MTVEEKPVEWIASSKEELSRFPREVRQVIGLALYQAQIGAKHHRVKPLTGHKDFKGAGVLEIIDDFSGDTYRAVYTVKFAGVVYVLHAFQKKSTKGVSTSPRDIELIKSRLTKAREHYEQYYVKKRQAG